MSGTSPPKKIFVTTFRTMELREVIGHNRKPSKFELPAGRHELVRFHNPLGFKKPWLVLASGRAEDRVIGMSEPAWRQYTNGVLNEVGQPIDWGDFEVRFEET